MRFASSETGKLSENPLSLLLCVSGLRAGAPQQKKMPNEKLRKELAERNWQAEHNAALKTAYSQAVYDVFFPCTSYQTTAPVACSVPLGAMVGAGLQILGTYLTFSGLKNTEQDLDGYVTPGLSGARRFAVAYFIVSVVLSGAVICYGLRERSRRESGGCAHVNQCGCDFLGIISRAQLACFGKFLLTCMLTSSVVILWLAALAISGNVYATLIL